MYATVKTATNEYMIQLDTDGDDVAGDRLLESVKATVEDLIMFYHGETRLDMSKTIGTYASPFPDYSRPELGPGVQTQFNFALSTKGEVVVFVKLAGSKGLAVKVPREATTGELKQEVERLQGVKRDGAMRFATHEGDLLDETEGKSLYEMGIDNGSVVHWEKAGKRRFGVAVAGLADYPIQVDVPGCETVAYIKDYLKNRIRISRVDENGEYVPSTSTGIPLIFKLHYVDMNLHLVDHSTGKTHQLAVDKDLLVWELKGRIEELTGHSHIDQVLTMLTGCNGESVTIEPLMKATLADAGVTSSETVIDLWIRSFDGGTYGFKKPKLEVDPDAFLVPSSKETGFHLFIKTLTGKTVTLTVWSSMLALHVKFLIQGREGIPMDHQRLLFAGKQLENGNSISQYGIARKAVGGGEGLRIPGRLPPSEGEGNRLVRWFPR